MTASLSLSLQHKTCFKLGLENVLREKTNFSIPGPAAAGCTEISLGTLSQGDNKLSNCKKYLESTDLLREFASLFLPLYSKLRIKIYGENDQKLREIESEMLVFLIRY